MNVAIVIPARYGSSRYRGKPLAKILGREMVLRVADICKKITGKKNLYIATDSKLIENVVKKDGYKTIITSKKCLTGTDRVAEASRKIKADIIINVTSGGPGGATDSVTSFIYREYRDRSNVGYGTFLAIVYLILIVIFMTFLIKMSERWSRPRY